MNNIDRIYSMLGLAQKGRNLLSGSEACKIAVMERKAKLVILSEDCARNTSKFFTDKCKHRNIPVIKLGSRERLGRAIGKDSRAVVAITDSGISRTILKIYSHQGKSSGIITGGDIDG